MTPIGDLPPCTCQAEGHGDQSVISAGCPRHGVDKSAWKREPRQRRSSPQRTPLKRGKGPKQKTVKQKLLDARWEGIKDATIFYLRKLDPDGTHCFECGTIKGPFDLDHIVPRGRGGKYWTFNSQLLCRPCHSAKHGQPEWTTKEAK